METSLQEGGGVEAGRPVRSFSPAGAVWMDAEKECAGLSVSAVVLT